ncbi:acyl carrier protein [Streptomyces sp. ME19-01-6]|uniref:acyl carrier protein n=1 Tax=Streptomyces sp. ME19-01-6 TaxID=3028686 RepID=UPI0029A7BE19|nr:acyl carrier protein [Streptomyces sp. ME19-01-6]MDX3228675.1 acyl carrier protein [Streptomyces sp. ME19-01-6]
MNESMVLEAVVGQLRKQGYSLRPEEYDTDLISAGVNSVNLVRLLSTLEDSFNVEIRVAKFAEQPVTVARLAELIISNRGVDAER